MIKRGPRSLELSPSEMGLRSGEVKLGDITLFVSERLQRLERLLRKERCPRSVYPIAIADEGEREVAQEREEKEYAERD